MGFRINTNIGAMNAHRNATMTNIGLDKSLNSLSSGLRINKAADDASGMAIADTLRQQANGLGQAIMNANDAIGVTQTADGALEEYTKIIDTIRTKAIQAASDGQNLGTRQKIQEDIDRLMQEAQNIATTTSFNGQTLLNGAFQNKSFHIGAYAGETIKLSIDDTQTDNVAQFALSEGTTAVSTGAAGTVVGQIAVTDAAGISVDTGAITFASNSTSLENAQILVDAFNADAQTEGADLRASVFELDSSTAAVPAYSIRIDSSDDFTVDTDDSGTGTTGIATSTKGTTNTFDTIDVTTRESAEKAIIISDYALKDIDKTRSDIGSVQNQLESTVRNISVTQVNVKAAESQIRDVDFAAESANFAKMNILAQSGSYAMSQANAVQQNVLRLLQ
ncbi:flagellin [Sulfurimonas lithotrophica]|uniref:Flagellin n=1 Tax=Sulfurimonas lithotrophica TaxID=2590022 RepID=A0A5P8NY32_9BACT|nr:flagellin [Sulfurimonas lithotrophica]QFR48338.1 flagellin [Sulfurimonas lithotrophica]